MNLIEKIFNKKNGIKSIMKMILHWTRNVININYSTTTIKFYFQTYKPAN